MLITQQMDDELFKKKKNISHTHHRLKYDHYPLAR